MTTDSPPPDGPRFRDLALPEALLRSLDAVGYESPSPIQAETIPYLLAGRDLVGQAQTGTGKTAAFALPALARTDLGRAVPQTLVLVPTRELAIQVAEAFQRYAAGLPGFHVLPIYGGQSYEPQLKGLKRGVHAVVGTPGRVVDHMKRGTLSLDGLGMMVLDEADEMLRMGFIEEVEWVLQQTPPTRQVALFSATMPPAIRRVASTYLKNPAEVHIQSRTTTANNIRQRFWLATGSKLDALTRILETETFEAMLVFTRTKTSTVELAEKLEARGFSAAPLNGDLDQKQRERTVWRLREGLLDIVVATDVAARGLDVERISHVVNYDIPTDPESYVHRIGRTGRAGRSGEAILFIAPRERHLLRTIERATRQSIGAMSLPTDEALQDKRMQRFQQAVLDVLNDPAATAELDRVQELVERIEREQSVPAARLAAVLARLGEKSKKSIVPPMIEPAVKPAFEPAPPTRSERPARTERPARPVRPALEPSPFPMRPSRSPSEADRRPERPSRPPSEADARPERPSRPAVEGGPRVERPARPPVDVPLRPERPAKPKKKDGADELETFRVEVGLKHGVKPGNIVGALANEAGLDAEHIGKVDIRDDHSLVDLPVGMPRKIFRDLQKVWVAGQQLKISRAKPQ